MIRSNGASPGLKSWGIALPFCLLLFGEPGQGGELVCGDLNRPVGQAAPIARGTAGGEPNWKRLDLLTQVARNTCDSPRDLSFVAKVLRQEGERTVGPLSPLDRYWLGTAWWAFHQPEVHLRYPDWALRAQADPNVALRHPEGGNCESSANAHAALLVYLGIPSKAVYGHLRPSGEGHVWTISDVDGHPLAADVHLARATPEQRNDEGPWRPSPAQIQTVPSWAASTRFSATHLPEDPRLSGQAQP